MLRIRRRNEEYIRKVVRHFHIMMTNVLFCSSSTSSSAADGSPLKSIDILSISSKGIPDLLFLVSSDDAFGSAPHRLFDGPESRFIANAAKDIHELASSACATDMPSDVLPTPGGPAAQIGPIFRKMPYGNKSMIRSFTSSRP